MRRAVVRTKESHTPSSTYWYETSAWGTKLVRWENNITYHVLRTEENKRTYVPGVQEAMRGENKITYNGLK